jgi:hypothetical protein
MRKGNILCVMFGLLGLFTLLFPRSIFASPPPSEIEKAKAAAPIHLIGTVTSDQLYKDLTKEKGNPYQIRRMTLSVKRVIKAPQQQKISKIAVYYFYTPSWENDKSGGQPMNIAVGDVIEIWLKKGEVGWEPSFDGYTVNHLKYAKKRSEPIPEPFAHMIQRHFHEAWSHHSDLIVLLGIILFLVVFVIVERKASDEI